jgi:DNA polymerase (family 10)
MPDVSNAAIADALEELGDLYELDGAIVHRVLAYRNAARAVRESSLSVAALARAGKATALPGIGETLQQKIVTFLDTGTTPSTERMRAQFPPGLIAMTRLQGLGPKRARLLHKELGIETLEQLREAALAQRLRGVRGLGPKFEASVLLALEAGATQAAPRLLLPAAIELGEALAAGLREHAPSDTRVELAGSARRRVDAVKDIDLIATTAEPQALSALLEGLEQIEAVSSAGAAGARGRTHSGMSVDLRVARPEQHGNRLQHFTGSGRHNTALREAAVRRGLHVSEYGVLQEAGAPPGEARAGEPDGPGTSSRARRSRAASQPHAGDRPHTRTCATEAEVYELLGLAYIEPELRENRGELEAAALDGELPQLIAEGDVRGDLHCHTVASDGRASIAEMAHAARERGYEYLAITDHSASHGFGNDVSPDELRRQIERVAKTNAAIEGIELLAGSEVNILPDGSLDYDDELLAQLDWVVASVHTAFGMGEQRMTERMIAAIEHPLVDAIGHPTGRLIERREPYELDLEAVFAAAARTGTMLEINANPARRDLSDVHARAAARAGVRLVIDSDAHRPDTLANMRWGIATARRAWLSKEDVANTRPWSELEKLRTREGSRKRSNGRQRSGEDPGGDGQSPASSRGSSSSATTRSTASRRKGSKATKARPE